MYYLFSFVNIFNEIYYLTYIINEGILGLLAIKVFKIVINLVILPNLTCGVQISYVE